MRMRWVVKFMSCDQTEKISLLIDGELATADARSLERHLAGCAECEQVHADFLGLRSQISAYALRKPAVLRAELAKVLRKPFSRPEQRRWLTGIFGSADALRFNTPFAAVAALLLVTFAVGTIALMRYLPQTDVAHNNSTTDMNAQAQASPATTEAVPLPIPSVSQSSNTLAPQDQHAENSGRKPGKTQPREAGPNTRKPNSRIKPSRERSAPKPLPQLRNEAPPTYASIDERMRPDSTASIQSADAETLTASHLEQSELLLRAFRNVRAARAGVAPEIAYERRRAQQLLYQNIMLRREADKASDVQVATLLGSLEPILLDIANLRDKPRNEEVRTIKERVERKSLVALLQVNSTAMSRAFE